MNSNGKTSFSQDLRSLAETFGESPVRVRELLDATRGRGFDLLLVLVSLPFVTPIPLPGLSTPFGLVAMLVGARLALGRRPWLPRAILDFQLPPRFLLKLLRAASRIVHLLEYAMKPRLAFMHRSPVFKRIAGGLIMISGFLLLLPLPIPYSNMFPAVTILLFAAGALEEDGAAFLAGCVMFSLTIGFFILIGLGGVHVFDRLLEWLR